MARQSRNLLSLCSLAQPNYDFACDVESAMLSAHKDSISEREAYIELNMYLMTVWGFPTISGSSPSANAKLAPTPDKLLQGYREISAGAGRYLPTLTVDVSCSGNAPATQLEFTHAGTAIVHCNVGLCITNHERFLFVMLFCQTLVCLAHSGLC